MRALTRRHWSGAEHLPDGPFVVVANHFSNIDPLTVIHFLVDNGHYPKVMAKAGLFRIPGLRWLLRRTGMIPVARASANASDSLPAAHRALAAGECVLLFPEGTFTRDDDLWPMSGRTGAARLALTAGVPLIPVAHWGEHDLMPRHTFRLRPIPRKPVWVVAGPPVDLDDLAGRPLDSAVLAEATDRMMARITAQLATVRGGTPPAEPLRWRPDRNRGYRL